MSEIKRDMSRSYYAYDEQKQKLAIGNLDYIGEKISVFSVSEFLKRKHEIAGNICIESRLSYEEVYSASIDRVEANKIFLKSIRNISEELKEDIKVDYQRVCEVSYELKLGGKTESFVDQVKLLDLSSGGIGFISEKKYEIGKSMKIELGIAEIDFTPTVKILRRENMGRMLKYGCRFDKLSVADESKIRKAVYRLQIAVHKQRGMRG